MVKMYIFATKLIFKCKDMESLTCVLDDVLPMVQDWLRATVREEMEKVLAEDREKQKPQKLYTREQVCKMLDISKPTLWARTKAGEIKCSKVGRRVLYAESEIQKALHQ